MVSDPERLTLTVPEAAAVLGVHIQTAYAWANRGDLPVLRLGGRLLVKRLELERMCGKPTALQGQ
jgi:excisionase family DNA binding protein